MRPPPGDVSRPTGSVWLEGLRLREASAWRRLSEVYGPLVYAWCRRAELPAQDAPDVVQDVLRTVAECLEQFSHRGPGSFRAWLRAITLSRVADHRRRVQGQPVAKGGTDAAQRLAAAEQPHSDQDETSERALLLRVLLERLRPEFDEQTWKAFWRLIVGGHSSAQIGQELGMTADAVRQAKARILRRLRAELEET